MYLIFIQKINFGEKNINNLKKILFVGIFQIAGTEPNEITLQIYHAAPYFRIYSCWWDGYLFNTIFF